MDLVIFAILVWLARGVARRPDGRLRWAWRPRYPRDGMLFWIYLTVYSLGRFVIQFYRVDTPFALGLSQAQLLSVVTAMVGIWALVYQLSRLAPRARRGRAPQAAALEEDEEPTQADERVTAPVDR
jgi:prolipoprotein diacylglyceryltransferase